MAIVETARAAWAADASARDGGDNVLAVYSDGCILHLSVDGRTARAVGRRLQSMPRRGVAPVETGWSADGLMVAWVLPGATEHAVGWATFEPLLDAGLEEPLFGVRDLRATDAPEMDDFLQGR